MTLIQKELKNAYIGEYVTPVLLSIDSDLTSSTLASLQADGWTNIWSNNSYQLDSSGLYPTCSGNNKYCSVYITNAQSILSQATELEMYAEGYGGQNSWSGGPTIGLGNESGSDLGSNNVLSLGVSFTTASSSYASQELRVNNTTVASIGAIQPSGNYTIDLKYNYQTGLITYKTTVAGNNVLNSTYQCDSSQMSLIAGATRIIYVVGYGTGCNNNLKRVKIDAN